MSDRAMNHHTAQCCGDMSNEAAARNVAAMENCFRHYSEGRIAEALSYVAEDALIVSHFPKTLDFPFAGEWRGRNGARNWLQCLTDCFLIQSFETLVICGLGDYVTAMHNVRTLHLGTGAETAGVASHVVRLHDGFIVEFHEHFNALPLQAAILTARVLDRRRRL